MFLAFIFLIIANFLLGTTFDILTSFYRTSTVISTIKTALNS